MNMERMLYNELQRKMLKDAGYSNREIAMILHPKQTLNSRISHAKRKAIRDIIEGGDDR